jgi:hypothetical protein
MSKLRSRDNKWSHYATVTPDFCFVVPNNSAQSGVLSEVTEWVIRTRQPTITVRICNLSALTGDQSPLWNIERTLFYRHSPVCGVLVSSTSGLLRPLGQRHGHLYLLTITDESHLHRVPHLCLRFQVDG